MSTGEQASLMVLHFNGDYPSPHATILTVIFDAENINDLAVTNPPRRGVGGEAKEIWLLRRELHYCEKRQASRVSQSCEVSKLKPLLKVERAWARNHAFPS